MRELPFVIGVLGDFGGHPVQPIGPLRNRRFLTADYDEFDTMMAEMAPRLVLRVDDKLTGTEGNQLRVELDFTSIDDFSPGRVARRVEPLAQLLETRGELQNALDRMRSKDGLEGLIADTMRTRAAEDREGKRDLVDELLAKLLDPRRAVSDETERTIEAVIHKIDELLSAQMNAIVHHPEFRKLEGSWRGLHRLVSNVATGPALKIRVLSVTREDLQRDAQRASDLESSDLYRLICADEFDVFGGEPFAALIGDYEFSHEPEDMRALRHLAHVAAAAHAPFVAAASPAIVGLRTFTDLAGIGRHDDPIATPEHLLWRRFRESEEARWVALVLPRVLARLPYGRETKPVDEFDYEEAAGTPETLVWTSAAYAYATCLADAFYRFAWGARIFGMEKGGLVEGWPALPGRDDLGRTNPECMTEIAVSERTELMLEKAGLLPLLHLEAHPQAVFCSTKSCQDPAIYDTRPFGEDPVSIRLDYTLCAARFAHYLRIIARDALIGRPLTPAELRDLLEGWIRGYCTGPEPSAAVDSPRNQFERAKRPLAEARIDIEDIEGHPGQWRAILGLRPEFQLEVPQGWLRLEIPLPSPRSAR